MPKIINTILIFLLLFSVSQELSAAKIKPSQKSQSTQLNQLSNQIQQLQFSISQDQKTQNQINHAIKNNAATSTKLKKRLKELKQQLNEKQSTLSQLQQKQQSQQDELSSQNYFLHQQLRAAYFLSLENNKHDRLLSYIAYLNRARADSITELSQAVAELKSQQDQVVHQKAQLQTTLQKQQKTQKQLTAAQQNQQQQLHQVTSQIQQRNKQLKILIANKNALEQLITKLQTTQKNQQVHHLPMWSPPSGKSFAQLKGKFPWPVSGKLLNHFGSAISGSEIKYTGVIIGTALNQPVHAIYPGRVIFADTLKGLGLLLILDQGNGYLTLYGHNQSLYKKVGDIVRAGDLIAKVGNSGETGVSGLYFEIRHDGKPVNPELWCRK